MVTSRGIHCSSPLHHSRHRSLIYLALRRGRSHHSQGRLHQAYHAQIRMALSHLHHRVLLLSHRLRHLLRPCNSMQITQARLAILLCSLRDILITRLFRLLDTPRRINTNRLRLHLQEAIHNSSMGAHRNRLQALILGPCMQISIGRQSRKPV